MKQLLAGVSVCFVLLSLGCVVTEYWVITDSHGPYDNNVLTGQYEQAYIIPSSTVATIWSDGSDEFYSLVSQDWKGDQWLYTYNNFDPSGTMLFLDQTYCDPVRQSDCAILTSWNPDLPNAYPHGSEGAGSNLVDDPFDYIFNPSCSGARSLCFLSAVNTRIGECGSGLLADRQGAYQEISTLDRTNFRGRNVYHLPLNNSLASFNLTGEDGSTTLAPIYGQFNLYLDERLRTIAPVTPNARYQLRWLDSYAKTHGNVIDVGVTYGAMNANFKIKVRSVAGALDRM